MTAREALGWLLISGLGLMVLVSGFKVVKDAIQGDEDARDVLVILGILTSPLWFIGVLGWCFSG